MTLLSLETSLCSLGSNYGKPTSLDSSIVSKKSFDHYLPLIRETVDLDPTSRRHLGDRFGWQIYSKDIVIGYSIRKVFTKTYKVFPFRFALPYCITNRSVRRSPNRDGLNQRRWNYKAIEIFRLRSVREGNLYLGGIQIYLGAVIVGIHRVRCSYEQTSASFVGFIKMRHRERARVLLGRRGILQMRRPGRSQASSSKKIGPLHCSLLASATRTALLQPA